MCLSESNDVSNYWRGVVWQSKKGKQGLAKLKKGSIFASPDTVDGKVGVTGSGQGMTSFEARARGNKK